MFTTHWSLLYGLCSSKTPPLFTIPMLISLLSSRWQAGDGFDWILCFCRPLIRSRFNVDLCTKCTCTHIERHVRLGYYSLHDCSVFFLPRLYMKWYYFTFNYTCIIHGENALNRFTIIWEMFKQECVQNCMMTIFAWKLLIMIWGLLLSLKVE